ncbi:MAG: DUF4345 family protein [Chloroflexota bacterium]
MLHILKMISAVLTVATGVLAAVRPSAVPSFTGLKPTGPRGVTEIRSIFGGLFIGVGAYPLLVDATATYRMLGAMYLVIAGARLVSMLVDRSLTERSNLLSLGVEIVLGAFLIL